MITPVNPDERAQLAAEYALGTLSADELEQARALLHDEDFRAEVALWRGRLSPLLAEIEPVTPPAHLWAAIEQRIVSRPVLADNVTLLQRSAKRWRAAAGAATALAAALAILLVIPRQAVEPPSPPSVQPEPLVAVLGDERRPAKLLASWDAADRRLVVAADTLPLEARRTHELWVIPAGGTPQSLGILPGARGAQLRVAEAVARQLQSGATLAVSVEPSGGSPTGLPTGPVIATGVLEPV